MLHTCIIQLRFYVSIHRISWCGGVSAALNPDTPANTHAANTSHESTLKRRKKTESDGVTENGYCSGCHGGHK